MRQKKISRRFCKKICAYSLVLAITGSMVPIYPVMAEEEQKISGIEQNETEQETEIIEIASVEDLEWLAVNCHISEWSENKVISMTADIDLSDSEFLNIPVFCGVFKGNGHTISNYQYCGDGYVAGLFRYIEEGGRVENLYVTGTVVSTDEKQCIGAFCGMNKGTIRNCVFQGVVEGKNETGGIVGINEESGTLQNCTVKGTVTGYYDTGGIAGKNFGTIDNCSNYANVNHDSEWVAEDDEISLDIFQNIMENETDVKFASGVDTGGIAGFSRGIIMRSTNAGEIGYEHIGYNIGGIAGRQSGVIASCTNYGTVSGRKDIGGIVGQMEPYLELDKAESVREAINTLHNLIQRTLDDMQEGTDVLQSDVDSLKNYSDAVIDKGNELSERLSDFADSNVDQVNSLTDRMEYVLELLPDIMDDADAAGDSLDDLNDVIRKLNEDLNVSDKMDSSKYKETDYRRLSIVTGVGGKVSANSLNPGKGSEVTLKIEHDQGYELSTLRVTDANGREIRTVQKDQKTYTFTMPEENVLVSAVYRYTGAFLAQSNEGGIITITENEEGDVLIEAEPYEGYELREETITIDGQAVLLTDKKVSISRSAYASGGNPVLVKGQFEKKDSEYEITKKITCTSGTGGVVTVSTPNAEAGDEVYLVSVPKNGYRLKTLTVCTKSGIVVPYQTEAKRYRFVMPDEKVSVTAVYEPIQLVVTSNAGGDVVYTGGNDTKITLKITPDSGYTLNVPTVKKQNGETIPISKAEAGTWTYECYLDQVSEPARAEITFIRQSQSDTVEEALDRMNANTEILNNKSNEIAETVDKMRELITGADGDVKEWKDLSEEEKTELLNLVSDLTDDLSESGTAAAEILSDTALLAGVEVPYIKDAASAAHKDLESAADEVQNILDSLQNASSGLRVIVDYLNRQPELTFSKLGQEFDDNVDELCTQLRGITDSMKELGDHTADYSDKINDDLEAVNDQLNVVFNLLIDKVENLDQADENNFYSDVSEEEIETATTGRVDDSVNKGIVQGDINVGGIAGAMAIDKEDPEDNAAGSVEFSLGDSYTAKCIISGSSNEGYVTAKKDGAGGIAGYMRYGVITECKTSGSVESTEGDYIGGICGQSLALIKNSYALCALSGNCNVGGIAGFGTNIRDCCSMVTISEAQGRYGAIAGQIAQEEEKQMGASLAVSNNYYVGSDIYGIDNISYAGVAEPLTYQELLTREGLPNDFWHLRVTYKMGDRYLGTQELAYGESLEKLTFPVAPEVDGCYGVWPDVSWQTMTGNLLIQGEYKEHVTVVKSDGGNHGLTSKEEEQGKSLVLIEGVFTENAVLHTSVSEEVPPQEIIGKHDYVVYQVSLEQTDVKEDDVLQVRLLNPYEDAAVWICQDGTWQKADSKEKGQYLQTTMSGTTASFCIAEESQDVGILLIAAAGAAGMVAVILLIRHGIRKKKKLKPAS